MINSNITPIARVVTRLDEAGCRLRDGYACAACRAPDLSIRTGPDGRVQLDCQYGCPTDAILAALNLRLPDLFPNPVKGRGIGIGEGRGYSEESDSYLPVPFTDKDQSSKQPELLDLLEAHRAGELEPRPVRLGTLPSGASDDMARVALDLELLMGLRAAVFEDRPLPYSTTLCASRMGWGSNYGRASRAIRKLEASGVIECVGSMPPRPGVRFGTKLYAPPAVIAAEDGGPRSQLRDVSKARLAG